MPLPRLLSRVLASTQGPGPGQGQGQGRRRGSRRDTVEPPPAPQTRSPSDFFRSPSAGSYCCQHYHAQQLTRHHHHITSHHMTSYDTSLSNPLSRTLSHISLPSFTNRWGWSPLGFHGRLHSPALTNPDPPKPPRRYWRGGQRSLVSGRRQAVRPNEKHIPSSSSSSSQPRHHHHNPAFVSAYGVQQTKTN